MFKKDLLDLFEAMLGAYGKRNWWPAKTRFEVIVGAILTQNVSWKNAKIGVQALKKDGLLSPAAIINAPSGEISRRIKATRFYNQKTTKLKEFCRFLSIKYGNSLDHLFSKNKPADDLRKELLRIKGIGKETADSIVLYAGRKLSFVSDAYTQRFISRYGKFNGLNSYDEIRNFFMDRLPQDVYIYNEFHALIVHHCFLICKTNPLCETCAIRKVNNKLFCAYPKKGRPYPYVSPKRPAERKYEGL